MIATLHRAWQITLPEEVIQKSGLGEGSKLECSVYEDEIHLRPVNSLKKGVRLMLMPVWRQDVWQQGICTSGVSGK